MTVRTMMAIAGMAAALAVPTVSAFAAPPQSVAHAETARVVSPQRIRDLPVLPDRIRAPEFGRRDHDR